MAGNKNELAFNLKQHRCLTEFSQKTTSELLKMTRARYASYEEGRAEPNITTLKQIADFYEITIDELCFTKLEL